MSVMASRLPGPKLTPILVLKLTPILVLKLTPLMTQLTPLMTQLTPLMPKPDKTTIANGITAVSVSRRRGVAVSSESRCRGVKVEVKITERTSINDSEVTL